MIESRAVSCAYLQRVVFLLHIPEAASWREQRDRIFDLGTRTPLARAALEQDEPQAMELPLVRLLFRWIPGDHDLPEGRREQSYSLGNSDFESIQNSREIRSERKVLLDRRPVRDASSAVRVRDDCGAKLGELEERRGALLDIVAVLDLSVSFELQERCTLGQCR